MAGLLGNFKNPLASGGLLSDPMVRLQMGAAMMGGQTLGQQIGGGLQAAGVAKQAQQEAAKRNQTVEWLKTINPELAQAVEMGAIDVNNAYETAVKARTPKTPDFMNVGGKIVQVGQDGIPKVVYDPPEQVTTEITDVNGKRVLINKATGMPIRELGDSPSKQNNAPAGYQMNPDGQSMSRIPGYRDTNLAMDMRKEFDAQTKDFRAVRDSYNRIQASAQNPTPAGDLSLIFNYMKMLDPGSVVREAEFATAANAAPLLTRVGLDAEKLKGVWEGQRLTPEQRADFLNRSDQLYQEQDQTFQALADEYTGMAERSGLSGEDIVLTPRANARKKPGAFGDAAGGANVRKTQTGVTWGP